MTTQDEHEESIANNAHQEDDAKHNGYNVCLQSFMVSYITATFLLARLSFQIDLNVIQQHHGWIFEYLIMYQLEFKKFRVSISDFDLWDSPNCNLKKKNSCRYDAHCW